MRWDRGRRERGCRAQRGRTFDAYRKVFPLMSTWQAVLHLAVDAEPGDTRFLSAVLGRIRFARRCWL